jgi:hypothetical protein
VTVVEESKQNKKENRVSINLVSSFTHRVFLEGDIYRHMITPFSSSVADSPSPMAENDTEQLYNTKTDFVFFSSLKQFRKTIGLVAIPRACKIMLPELRKSSHGLSDGICERSAILNSRGWAAEVIWDVLGSYPPSNNYYTRGRLRIVTPTMTNDLVGLMSEAPISF